MEFILGKAEWERGSPPAWGAVSWLLEALGLGTLDEIKWQPNQSWFSTRLGVTTAIVSYYAIIFGGRELMKPHKPMKLQLWFQIHNLALSLASALLLALHLEQVVPIIWEHGFFFSICNESAWYHRLVTLYYLNYITKYIELVDTLFLVLKKKPLAFLHCYHHGATVLLCYVQLMGKTPVSYVPIVLNLAVHVIMYFYYFQSSRGVRCWWKEWVTKGQIIQFVLDLGVVYFASYTHYSYKWESRYLPTCGNCAGGEAAALVGCVILSSYLVLFISFYLATYVNRGVRAANKMVKSGVAVVPAPHPQAGADKTVRVDVIGPSSEKFSSEIESAIRQE